MKIVFDCKKKKPFLGYLHYPLMIWGQFTSKIRLRNEGDGTRKLNEGYEKTKLLFGIKLKDTRVILLIIY